MTGRHRPATEDPRVCVDEGGLARVPRQRGDVRPTPPGPSPDFDEYVLRRRDRLVRAARALGHDQSRAEDIVQSALERTYVAWPRIREPRAVDAYVRRAIYHEHVKSWRRSGRGAEVSTAEVREPHRSLVEGLCSALAFDERQRLWDLVRQLPPRQRAAVVLRYYEDLSEAETARILNCTVGTVKSNTSRGLATLRALTATTPAQWSDAA